MRTSMTIRWSAISLVLVGLVGIAGCGRSGGGADEIAEPAVNQGGFGSAGGAVEPPPDGSGSGGTGSGGAGSGGAPDPSGPWPVAISSGKVEPVSGRYCGGPNPTMSGEATVSVANGPVSIKVVWQPANGGASYGESTVQFSGTGPQSKTVTATWTRPWNSADTVRVTFVDLVPGPGQQADQYIPPNPHEIKYGVRPCLKPDITVKIVAVQVLPQKCSTGVAQASAVAHVTLENELTDSTGPVSASFRWERDGYASSWAKVTFQPGGPKTLTMPTVWTLPARGSFVAKAVVHVRVQQAPAHKYNSKEFNFATYCIS